jgi:hypothetical protein
MAKLDGVSARDVLDFKQWITTGSKTIVVQQGLRRGRCLYQRATAQEVMCNIKCVMVNV